MGTHYRYSKTCLKRPLKRRPKSVFQDQLLLNAGQKYCSMLQESILQYFRPSLSYHLSVKPLFCLFLSGRFRQVLLNVYVQAILGTILTPTIFKLKNLMIVSLVKIANQKSPFRSSLVLICVVCQRILVFLSSDRKFRTFIRIHV